MSWAEYAAQIHEEVECPVYRERELVDGLTAALRYFGVADLMAKVGEIMRADAHNSEYIWGDAERWFERERAEGAEQGSGAIGAPRAGGLRVSPIVFPPPDEWEALEEDPEASRVLPTSEN